MISYLQRKGYELPPFENGEGLTIVQILEVIKLYLESCDNAPGEGNLDGIFDGYFMELLTAYPNSMCSRQQGDKLQFVMALAYQDGLPTEDAIERWKKELALAKQSGYKGIWLPDEPQPNYSYENLAFIFHCSKSTVHAAIHKHGEAAAKIVKDVRLHTAAKDIALRELVEEQKKKLLEEQNKQNNQTTERTPETTLEEDNTRSLSDSTFASNGKTP